MSGPPVEVRSVVRGDPKILRVVSEGPPGARGPRGYDGPEGPEGPEGRPGPPGPSADGATLTFKVDTPMSGHRCVRMDGDVLRTVSVDDVTHADTCFALTIGGGAAGTYVEVQSGGVVEEPGWSWRPGPVFVGLDGVLTQTLIRGTFEQRVGTAVGPTRMLLVIEPAVISPT